MNEIYVNASSSYRILSERGLSAFAGKYIAELFPPSLTGNRKICIVCDENVLSLYGFEGSPLRESLKQAGFEAEVFCFPPGEESKSIRTLEAALEFLSSHDFTRSDLILALGGGVTGDLAGLAASLYMRGISYVQMPTTLLAAADSSIGGKTAVNMSAGKNLVGTFWQPSLVLFDPVFLETLPEDELLNGLAEIIKTAFISDGSVLDAISLDLGEAAMKAAEIKKNIVEADEREQNSRRLLNLGHTIGHAIEKCSGYSISHGIAVMTGMYLTSLAAEGLHWTQDNVSCLVQKVIDVFGYPVILDFSADELAAAALSDKKRTGDNITIIYPDIPGHCSMKSLPASELETFIASGLEEARKRNGN